MRRFLGRGTVAAFWLMVLIGPAVEARRVRAQTPQGEKKVVGKREEGRTELSAIHFVIAADRTECRLPEHRWDRVRLGDRVACEREWELPGNRNLDRRYY